MALPELKQKASGIFYLDLRDRDLGRVSLGTRDRAAAVEKRREFLASTAGTSPPEKPSRKHGNQPTMRDLFDRAQVTVWRDAKSQGTIRSNVKILNSLIGDEPVGDMTYTRLEKLANELEVMGYAPGTVRRKMDAVSKVLNMATRWTGPDGAPLLRFKPTMPTIKVSNTKDRILSRDEEEAVFKALEARRLAEPARQWRRMEVIVRFLLDTGARLGEALTVGPDSLTTVRGADRDVTLVTFARYRTKSDKPRSVPLTDEVLHQLDRLADDTGIDKATGRTLYFPVKQATVWYMWSNIRDDLSEAGMDISDVTLHTLRHTCLTRLAQGGMELLRLQKWAGHSDPKITAERYVHLRPDDLMGGLDILEGLNGGSPANRTFRKATAKRGEYGTLSVQ